MLRYILSTVLFISILSVVTVESQGNCEINDPDYKQGDDNCQSYKYICRNVTVEDFHEFLGKLCVDKCKHPEDNLKSESVCRHLKELTLEDLQSTYLNKEFFTGVSSGNEVFDGVMTGLTSLKVGSDVLVTVHSDIMEVLPNLKQVLLGGELLLNVSLAASESLEFLGIYHSHLLWFLDLGLMPNLTVLNLVNNSMPKLALDDDFSINAPNLQMLDISSNQLGRGGLAPGEFSIFPALKFLNLSSNLIENVTYGLFENLENLEWLDLSYNKIENLEPAVLSSLSSLEILKLSHNKLKRLDLNEALEYLPNLNTFLITDNEFDCDYLHTVLPKKLSTHVVDLIASDYKIDYTKPSVRGVNCVISEHEYKTDIDDVNKMLGRINSRLEKIEKRQEFISEKTV